jgi:shikimate dehydrogenase
MITLALTGYPLAHSLSPRIHQAALKYCQLEGEYSLFPVAPHDHGGLTALLEQVRAGEVKGLNVTIPHKQAIMPLLDELTPAAEAIGAVNTVFMRAGVLVGDNTDAPGFLSDLRCFLEASSWNEKEDRQALLLGAGGAAHAVAYALLDDGWRVSIAARRAEQARELMNQFPQDNGRLSSLGFSIADLRAAAAHCSLVVNATPVGMSPRIDSSPWPEDVPLPGGAAVYDLVYNPRQTKLVGAALDAGLPAQSGLGMLVEQAALAFEIWTGCRVPRDVLYSVVEVA